MMAFGALILVKRYVYCVHLPKRGESMSWYHNRSDRDRLEKVLGCPAASYTEMSSPSNKVINSTSCARFLSEELFHLDRAVMTKSCCGIINNGALHFFHLERLSCSQALPSNITKILLKQRFSGICASAFIICCLNRARTCSVKALLAAS